LQLTSSNANLYSQKDFNSGYKLDLGWIPETRVINFGSNPDLGEITGGTFVLGAIDSGSLNKFPTSALGSRFRHPTTWYANSPDRYYYLTHRYRSVAASQGIVVNDVPHGQKTAGTGRLFDTTPGTPYPYDGYIDSAQAYVHNAADASYLIENLGRVYANGDSSDPANAGLSVRVSRFSSKTYTTELGLGCYGVSCQPAPSTNITDVSVACLTSRSSSSSVSVPVSELGSPSVFRVMVPNLASNSFPSCLMTAKMCLPSGYTFSSYDIATISLAAFDTVPVAEMLTASPVDKGSSHWPGVRRFNTTSGAFDPQCLQSNFLVTGSKPAYVAASARFNTAKYGFYNSSSSAPSPFTLTIGCASTIGGQNSNYGWIYDAMSANAILVTTSSFTFGGVYILDPSQPTLNGALNYVMPGQYRIFWSGGSWYFTPFENTTRILARQADANKNLLAITQFNGAAGNFRATPSCPLGAIYSLTNAGCWVCPANSYSRGGYNNGFTISNVANGCKCNPGYYQQTGTGVSVYRCVSCAADTMKERAGNLGTASVDGCTSCPNGLKSSGTSGPTMCYPSVSPTESYYLCKKLNVSGTSTSGAVDIRDGVYVLQTEVSSSSATTSSAYGSSRDGSGEGLIVYKQQNSPWTEIVGFPPSESSVINKFWYWYRDPSWAVDTGNPVVLLYRQDMEPPQFWDSDELQISWTYKYAYLAQLRCLCDYYAPFEPGLVGSSCDCDVTQEKDAASGRCVDKIVSGCSRGYYLPSGSTTCIDINECANNNGGCSHGCTNLVDSMKCTCPPGWGVDSKAYKTCSPCSDDQYVDSTAGVCTSCPSGMRRDDTGNSCGCPYGYILVSSGGTTSCLPPAVITLDAVITNGRSPVAVAPKTFLHNATSFDISSSPFPGKYVACQPSASMPFVSSDTTLSLRVWQQIERGNSSVKPSLSPLYLVFEPGNAKLLQASQAYLTSGAVAAFGSTNVTAATAALVKNYDYSGGMWSIYAGGYNPVGTNTSITASTPPSPRYAFALNSELAQSSSWPTSTGSTKHVKTAMLPAGTQSWHVYTPWPSGFNALADLQVTVGYEAAKAVASLPICGSASLDTLSSRAPAAVSAAEALSTGVTGDSTLGFGAVGLVVVSPSSTPSASVTPSRTADPSVTPSGSGSPSVSSAVTASPSGSATSTLSASGSATVSGTASSSASVSSSHSSTASLSISPSESATGSASVSLAPSASSSLTLSPSSAASGVVLSGEVGSPVNSDSSSASTSNSPSLSPTPTSSTTEEPSSSSVPVRFSSGPGVRVIFPIRLLEVSFTRVFGGSGSSGDALVAAIRSDVSRALSHFRVAPGDVTINWCSSKASDVSPDGLSGTLILEVSLFFPKASHGSLSAARSAAQRALAHFSSLGTASALPATTELVAQGSTSGSPLIDAAVNSDGAVWLPTMPSKGKVCDLAAVLSSVATSSSSAPIQMA
jgi:hypothetical protein